MKRQAVLKMNCPCCGKKRGVDPQHPPLSREIDAPDDRPSTTSAGWTLRYAGEGKLHWACERCLASGRAIRASPRLQTYLDYPPYLSYYDTSHRCTDCGDVFVFGKSEQRYWYETLKFWVQSVPRQCPNCRRRRRRKAANLERLHSLLESSDLQNAHHLFAIGAAYLETGNVVKGSTYLRRARNAATRRDDNDLLKRINGLLESPGGSTSDLA